MLCDFLFLVAARRAFPDRNAGDEDERFAGDRGARRSSAAAGGERPGHGRRGARRPYADAAPHATSHPRATLSQGPVYCSGRVQISSHRMISQGTLFLVSVVHISGIFGAFFADLISTL